MAEVILLRANTFLVLLFRAMTKHRKPKVVTDLFNIMLEVGLKQEPVDPSVTSRFLEGKQSISSKFCFDDENMMKRKRYYCEHYHVLLNDMNKFCQKYINYDQRILQYLIGGIVRSVSQDSSYIGTVFCIGDKNVSCENLPEQKTIHLQVFLLDVLFKIVTKFMDTSSAADTYEKWTTGPKKEPNTDIGNDCHINVITSMDGSIVNKARLLATEAVRQELHLEDTPYDGFYFTNKIASEYEDTEITISFESDFGYTSGFHIRPFVNEEDDAYSDWVIKQISYKQKIDTAKIKEVILNYESITYKSLQNPSQKDGFKPMEDVINISGLDVLKVKRILYHYHLLQAYNIFKYM